MSPDLDDEILSRFPEHARGEIEAMAHAAAVAARETFGPF